MGEGDVGVKERAIAGPDHGVLAQMENPRRFDGCAGWTTPPDVSLIARVAAVAALVVAIVVVVLLLFGGGSAYTVKIEFQDASGLVSGDLVMIGPANVGSVQSIGLSPMARRRS